MNNLLPELSFEVYYYAEYTIKIDMYEGFTPSGAISMDVMNWGKVLYSITGTYNSGTRRISIPITMVQIQGLPPIAECKIKDGSTVLFPALVKPVKFGQPDNGQSYSVTLVEGVPVVVEVMGMTLVQEQVDIATDKAQEATQSASTATTQAGIATTGANTATSASATAVAAQEAAEEARDIAVANSVERIYVDTYAEAEPYFTGPMPRKVFVTEDLYNDMESSFYDYDPEKGAALLGIDFNYKEEQWQ